MRHACRVFSESRDRRRRYQSSDSAASQEASQRSNPLRLCQRPYLERIGRVRCDLLHGRVAQRRPLSIRDLRGARSLPRDPATARRALVIHNSPYRFGDTARKYSYETIPVDASRDIGSFLPDGVAEVEPDGSIFRKLKSSPSRSGMKPATRVTVPARLARSRGNDTIHVTAEAAPPSTAHRPAAWRRKEAHRASPREAPGLHSARPFPASACTETAASAGGSPGSRGLRR